jgi:hypothetical protein
VSKYLCVNSITLGLSRSTVNIVSFVPQVSTFSLDHFIQEEPLAFNGCSNVEAYVLDELRKN